MAAMRGKVMAYDPSTGKGIVGAGNDRYEFSLQSWVGSDIPSIGRTVEITVGEDGFTTFAPVPEGDIVKERLEVVGKNLAATGSNVTIAAIARHGYVMLGAIAAFFVASLALDVVSIRMMGMSRGISAYDFFTMSSGFGKFTLIVAWIGLVVPLVWADKQAYRALLIPLAPVAVLCWKFWETYSVAREQMASMGSIFGRAATMPSFLDVVNPGAGFYVLIASATVLAFIAIKNLRLAA